MSLVNERHPHRDWGWVLEFEAEKPPTRKQVAKYLRDAGLPGHISVTKPGDVGGGRAGEERQGGGGSSRWRIETAKADVECHRWVRDFGTDVTGKTMSGNRCLPRVGVVTGRKRTGS